MKKYLIIEADTNDADYVTSETNITKWDEKDIEDIKLVAKAIKKFKPYKGKSKDSDYEWTHTHNFPTNDCCREDLGEKSPKEIYKDKVSEEAIELFQDICPYGEYGIHTIKTVKILTVTKEEHLL